MGGGLTAIRFFNFYGGQMIIIYPVSYSKFRNAEAAAKSIVEFPEQKPNTTEAIRWAGEYSLNKETLRPVGTLHEIREFVIDSIIEHDRFLISCINGEVIVQYGAKGFIVEKCTVVREAQSAPTEIK